MGCLPAALLLLRWPASPQQLPPTRHLTPSPPQIIPEASPAANVLKALKVSPAQLLANATLLQAVLK